MVGDTEDDLPGISSRMDGVGLATETRRRHDRMQACEIFTFRPTGPASIHFSGHRTAKKVLNISRPL